MNKILLALRKCSTFLTEAQISFFLVFHSLPAEAKQTILNKIQIETGLFSLILTAWSQLWVVIWFLSYTVDFLVNL